MAGERRIVYADDVLARIERDRAYMTDVGRIHARSAVHTSPTVDAEPVVHGRWLSRSIWVECSVCHVSGSPQWKRCPVCEAKMDLPNITDQTKDAMERMGQKAHGGAENG